MGRSRMAQWAMILYGSVVKGVVGRGSQTLAGREGGLAGGQKKNSDLADLFFDFIEWE